MENENNQNLTPTNDEPQPNNGSGEDNGGGAPKQTEVENKAFAAMRRQLEEKEALIKARDEEIARYKSIEVNGVSNESLTELGLKREDLSDTNKLNLAKAYDEGKLKGEQNPREYAYKTAYSKDRELEANALKEKQAKEDADKQFATTINSFRSKYGEEAYKKDLADENSDFRKRYSKVLNTNNLLDLYEIYKGENAVDDESATHRTIPPSGNNGGGLTAKDFDNPLDELSNMTDEQYRAYKKEHGYR